MHVASDEDWQIADSQADERFYEFRAKVIRERREHRANELSKLLKVHEARKAAGYETTEKAAIDAERRENELNRLLEKHERESMLDEEEDCVLRVKGIEARDEMIIHIKERFLQFKKVRSDTLNRVQIGILRGTNSQKIMSLLKQERQNLALQIGGFTTLIQLTHNNSTECEKAGGRLFAASGLKQENGCDCVINGLKQHLSEPLLVVKALGVVGNLCLFQPNGKRFFTAGAMETVLRCGEEFQYNPMVLREICRSISQLCLSCSENTDVAVELGAMGPTMRILKGFGMHPITGTEACNAVLALIAENDDLLEEGLNLGLLSWCFETLDSQIAANEIFDRQRSAIIVRNALRILTLIVSSGVSVKEEDLLTMFSALQTHIADAYAQLYALQLLHAAMAPEHPQRDEQIQILLAAQKSHEVVVRWIITAMSLHLRVGNIQWQGCSNLLLLIEAEPRISTAYRQCLGLQVIAKGLRENTHLPPVLEQYCRLISVTGTNVVDRSTYANASLQCPQVIQKLLYVHRNHLGVQHFGNLALKVLAKK